jgi:hypothetical protein
MTEVLRKLYGTQKAGGRIDAGSGAAVAVPIDLHNCRTPVDICAAKSKIVEW